MQEHEVGGCIQSAVREQSTNRKWALSKLKLHPQWHTSSCRFYNFPQPDTIWGPSTCTPKSVRNISHSSYNEALLSFPFGWQFPQWCHPLLPQMVFLSWVFIEWHWPLGFSASPLLLLGKVAASCPDCLVTWSHWDSRTPVACVISFLHGFALLFCLKHWTWLFSYSGFDWNHYHITSPSKY